MIKNKENKRWEKNMHDYIMNVRHWTNVHHLSHLRLTSRRADIIIPTTWSIDIHIFTVAW
jgi:hypothetical protein